MLLLVTLTSRADLTNLTATASPGALVPDANPVGLTSTINISGMSGYITNLTVNLDITGGFNGDLYAYLLAPDGSMVVLLNRVGMGTNNVFGYSDAGFNISLTSAATNNIHDYQSGSYGISNGQLTNSWAADSRMVDPMSAPSVFDLAPTGYTLANLTGLYPNGDWTLFIADLSSGGQSTFVSWGLTIVTVPEPQTWTLLGGSLVGLWMMTRRQRK